MKNSKIEWCDHSVNFWWGCEKVSPACAHCYAELLAKLFSKGKATWGATGQRWDRSVKAVDELLALDMAARQRGAVERVFINSMSDTFEDREDLNQARSLLFFWARRLANLDLLLLTKRPENVARLVPPDWLEDWPAHVWMGTTAENQAMADERIPQLLNVPAAVRFLSCEPLLGQVDLHGVCFENESCESCGEKITTNIFTSSCSCRCCCEGSEPCLLRGKIEWVICGGESGAGARPMHPDWARALRDQCDEQGVPFFFKQWGEWAPTVDVGFGDSPRAKTHSFPTGKFIPTLGGAVPFAIEMRRIGKSKAGRLLDGREWNEVPVTPGRAVLSTGGRA